MMSYEIRAEEVEFRPLALIRMIARPEDLATVVPRACGEVWEAVKKAGIANPGRLVAIYLDDAIHLEVGVEISGSVPPNCGVVASVIPAGVVAWTTHIGPYQRLGDAHDAIASWCEQNGHERAGPNWEINGHGSDDPAQIRTDVFHLLKGS